MAYKGGSGQTVGIRLLLLRDYFNSHASRTRAVPFKDVMTYLDNEGFHIDRKTLYTDLDALRTYFHMEIEYSQPKRGYLLYNPPFEPYELRLMVDSIQSAKFITQTKARDLTNRIKNFADEKTRATLNRQAYVSDRIRSMNDTVMKDADRLHEAIETDRKIKFQYTHHHPDKSQKKTYSKQGDFYTVSPFALSWNNGNYYLYAYDGKKFRYFRVDRMERIGVPLTEPREGKELFDAKRLTVQEAKVFDMYNGPAYNVKIRFLFLLADAIIDRFGADVMMMPTEDPDFYTVTVPVEVSPPFYAWVATFGRRMKILGPAPVVEGMKKFIAAAADMYKDAGDV